MSSDLFKCPGCGCSIRLIRDGAAGTWAAFEAVASEVHRCATTATQEVTECNRGLAAWLSSLKESPRVSAGELSEELGRLRESKSTLGVEELRQALDKMKTATEPERKRDGKRKDFELAP